MQLILQAINDINLSNIKDAELKAQAFNIMNLIRMIEDFQKQSTCAPVQQYRDYGVSKQEIMGFLNQLQDGEADTDKYTSILGRLRKARDTLLDIQNKDREERLVDAEVRNEEDEEDAEVSKLRALVTKLTMKISNQTRHISRRERDWIAKSLLDYISLMKDAKTITEKEQNDSFYNFVPREEINMRKEVHYIVSVHWRRGKQQSRNVSAKY